MVVQFCGNFGVFYFYWLDQCMMEIVCWLNVEGINFYVLLVLSLLEFVDVLCCEFVIQEQMVCIFECSFVFYFVGGIELDSYLVKCGVVIVDELKGLEVQGVCGVIVGQVIDGDGQWMDCVYNCCCILVSIEFICFIFCCMMVVEQMEKFDVFYVVICGGLVSYFVVILFMVQCLLECFDVDVGLV